MATKAGFAIVHEARLNFGYTEPDVTASISTFLVNTRELAAASHATSAAREENLAAQLRDALEDEAQSAQELRALRAALQAATAHSAAIEGDLTTALAGLAVNERPLRDASAEAEAEARRLAEEDAGRLSSQRDALLIELRRCQPTALACMASEN